MPFLNAKPLRGEVKVLLVNLSNEDFTINDGERIAQMVIAKHEQIDWYVVAELDDSSRGAGGFGSSGVLDSQGD